MRGLLLLLLVICSGGALASPPDPARELLVMLRAPAVHDTPEAGYVGDYRNAPGRQARERIARKLAKANGLTMRNDWAMPALGVDCYVLQARDESAVAAAVEALARDPRVESVQAMQQFEVLGDDPLAPAQPARKLWNLDAVHRHATGRGVTVAVIDSGVAAAHADLRGQVAASRDFVDDDSPRVVPETHGTEVAGLIAARADNALGIAGVAPQARLLALRACWQPDGNGRARCNSFTLAKALQFAIEERAQVINLSLGGPRDVLLGRLIDVALARGASVVAAVDPHAPDAGFPASQPGVIAVAGDPSRAWPIRTFLAPADALPTTTVDGGWGLVNGTSFAAAQVSGLVALLRDAAPKLRGSRVRDALADVPALVSATARPLPIDACAAFARAGPGCACGCRLADAQETPRH